MPLISFSGTRTYIPLRFGQPHLQQVNLKRPRKRMYDLFRKKHLPESFGGINLNTVKHGEDIPRSWKRPTS